MQDKFRNGVASEAKLAMRSRAHQFQAVVIRLAVDENEVGPDVAVAVIAAMAAGVTDRLWNVEDLVAAWEASERRLERHAA